MSYDCEPTFTAEDLYSAMLNPSVTSKGQIKRMRDEPKSVNRLQDIWVCLEILIIYIYFDMFVNNFMYLFNQLLLLLLLLL